MYFLVAGQVLIKTEVLAEAEVAAKVVVHMRVREVQEIRQQHLLMAGMERHQTHNRVVMEAQVQLAALNMLVAAVVDRMQPMELEVTELVLLEAQVVLALLQRLVEAVLLMLVAVEVELKFLRVAQVVQASVVPEVGAQLSAATLLLQTVALAEVVAVVIATAETAQTALLS
jgi:hypothetical protein